LRDALRDWDRSSDSGTCIGSGISPPVLASSERTLGGQRKREIPAGNVIVPLATIASAEWGLPR
jgi:hypothetical protein